MGVITKFFTTFTHHQFGSVKTNFPSNFHVIFLGIPQTNPQKNCSGSCRYSSKKRGGLTSKDFDSNASAACHLSLPDFYRRYTCKVGPYDSVINGVTPLKTNGRPLKIDGLEDVFPTEMVTF